MLIIITIISLKLKYNLPANRRNELNVLLSLYILIYSTTRIKPIIAPTSILSLLITTYAVTS